MPKSTVALCPTRGAVSHPTIVVSAIAPIAIVVLSSMGNPFSFALRRYCALQGRFGKSGNSYKLGQSDPAGGDRAEVDVEEIRYPRLRVRSLLLILLYL